MQSALILVNHDRGELRLWGDCLQRWGIPFSQALDAFTALEMIQIEKTRGVIVRADLPLISGFTLSKRIKKEHPDVEVILVSGRKGVSGQADDSARKTWELGMGALFESDFQKIVGMLLLSGGFLLKEDSYKSFLKEDPEFDGIIGSSAAIKEVFSLIAKVRDQDVTVLIQGESGTGKELVAWAIHRHSRRAQKPFISVNCAALPETLLESELFGHEKGSFTGAESRVVGRFEQADQGCLFLDEIGDMSPATQAKVLRVMEGHEFERVGGRQKIKVDVRIIAATNRDLRRRVAEGLFRDDLFYRIGAFPVMLPPLRERTEDMPLVIAYILRKYNRIATEKITGITLETLEKMLDFPWPGNIRQLENFINRAAILAERGVIRDLHLIPMIDQSIQPDHSLLQFREDQAVEPEWEGKGKLPASFPFKSLAEMEKEAISHALRVTGMNISQAAAGLGISRPTLYKKAKKYGVEISRQALRREI